MPTSTGRLATVLIPGAHIVHEALLKRLGVDDYGKLLAGKLAWTDPAWSPTR